MWRKLKSAILRELKKLQKKKSVTYCTYVRGRGTNANEVEHLEERRIKKCEGLR